MFLRTVNGGINYCVKSELKPKFFFNELFHFPYFMLVDSNYHRLKFKWEIPLHEKTNPSQASFKGTWNACDTFISFLCATIKSNLHAKGTPISQIVCNL